MIIFDRFLCCMSLKLFGKVIGWSGTVLCTLSAYAAFLIASGLKTAGKDVSNKMIFGFNLSMGSEKSRDETDKIQDFYYYTALVICLLLIIAAFHVMLLCGIKYRKSIMIVPYILLSVFVTASLICILPSEIHLSESNEHKATSIYIIIACILTLILSIYSTLCIYCLYGLVNYEEKRRKLYCNGDAILIAPLAL